MEERIQKILARAGLGSRRDCEDLIASGRVRVNGTTAALGDKADLQHDKISVDGRALNAPEPLVYVALHKPRGVLSAVEAPDPRPTVRDLVPVAGAIYPVGRLDAESEGLILLTNDGDLANRLTHPRYGHEKEYRVLVARRPDDGQLETFRRGVVLADGHRTAPAAVRIEAPFGKGAWLRVILREGRKRQIREMCGLIGLPVVRIVRIRIGSLQLGVLKPREWRLLSPEEVRALKGPATPKERPAPRRNAHPGKRAPQEEFDHSRPRRPARGKPENSPAGHSPSHGRTAPQDRAGRPDRFGRPGRSTPRPPRKPTTRKG